MYNYNKNKSRRTRLLQRSLDSKEEKILINGPKQDIVEWLKNILPVGKGLAWYTQYDSGSANFSLFLKVSKNTFRIYEQIADTWLGSDTPFHDSPKNWYSDEVFGHMYHRRGEHINNFLNNGQIVSSVKQFKTYVANTTKKYFKWPYGG